MLRVVALPRMPWKVLNCCSPVTIPPATLQSNHEKRVSYVPIERRNTPLVSKGPLDGLLVQMMGTMPIAKEIARTRSSVVRGEDIDCKTQAVKHTDVTVRGAHSSRSDTKNGLDGLARPAQLRHNLLIGEGRKMLARCIRIVPGEPRQHIITG